jgi:hypothetical protein
MIKEFCQKYLHNEKRYGIEHLLGTLLDQKKGSIKFILFINLLLTLYAIYNINYYLYSYKDMRMCPE